MISRMREFLEKLHLRYYLLVLIAIYAGSSLAFVSSYDFKATSLIRFGHYYADQNPEITPEGAVIFTGDQEHGGNGYDGQIFYYYARTLLFPDMWPGGFSRSYRAPRAGYPLLVSLFSPGGSHTTVFGMIFVQLALILAGTAALYNLLGEGKKYLISFYIISPFMLQSYMVMVSDGVMISLVILGYREYLRIDRKKTGNTLSVLFSFIWFSLAVMTKESSLFFLFPVGLDALRRRDPVRIALMLSVLAPMAGWQLYLREVHGILPAGKLSIFLSPFDGIFGLFRETYDAVAGFATSPATTIKALVKLSARWLLIAIIMGSLYAVMARKITLSRMFPGGLAVLLVLFSVIMADHFYFWGIYENISRMFTLLIPAAIIMKNEDESSPVIPLLGITALLAVMVIFRILFVTPTFPYDFFFKYEGPSYSYFSPSPTIRTPWARFRPSCFA